MVCGSNIYNIINRAFTHENFSLENIMVIEFSKKPQEVKEVTVYVCSICKASFEDNDDVVLHMVNNHQNEEKIEEILNNIPTVSQRIRGHKTKWKVQKSSKEYQCLLCTYKTVHFSTYKRHFLTHQKNGRSHRCPHCSFTSVQKQNLIRHIRNVHMCGTAVIEPIILVKKTQKATDTGTDNSLVMILTNE